MVPTGPYNTCTYFIILKTNKTLLEHSAPEQGPGDRGAWDLSKLTQTGQESGQVESHALRKVAGHGLVQ